MIFPAGTLPSMQTPATLVQAAEFPEKIGMKKACAGKSGGGAMHINPGRVVVLSFISSVKPDYAAERSWQQSSHGFATLRPAVRFGSIRESAGILEPAPLHGQTITSRNQGAIAESILICRNG
jgi:hypothetical protein